MRILFWSDGFWPRLGGIETQSLAFIQEMQKRGHAYQVFAERDLPSWKEDEIYEGISIQRFEFNAIIKKRDLTTLKSIQNSIEKMLREFKPDILHLNTGVGGSLFSFLLFKNMFSIPIILTFFGHYQYEGRVPLMVEQAMKSADQICCISDWVLRETKKHTPSIENKLRRIYCGLRVPEKMPLPLSFSPPILFALGRFVCEKGFDTLIRAFHLLKKTWRDAELILAGEGPLRNDLERLAKELGVTVKFTGVLRGEELSSAFNQATLVIVPSIQEAFGLVILEAMHRGRAVIASDVDGIPEIVLDEETGLLVPPNDPVSFCRAIQTLLNNPERAKKMGILGRERSSQFTLDEHASQYERAYEELTR